MHMLTESQAIRTYFAKLGLQAEIADLYLTLHRDGPQNISELSRNSGVERTRIYRLIDQLMETNLIEVETHNKRGIIKAAPIANLSILITQREQELRALQDELGLLQQVLARNSLSSPATRVQLYEGNEGTRHMLRNIADKKGGTLYILLNESLVSFAKSRFYAEWQTRVGAQRQTIHVLCSATFFEQHASWYHTHITNAFKHAAGRTLPNNSLPFGHTQFIYDETVAYCQLVDGELFGTSVHNPSIAHTEQRLFERLWEDAAPLTRATA